MSDFEFIPGLSWRDEGGVPLSSRTPGSKGPDLARAVDVVDVFVGGANVSAKAGPDAVFCITRDLLTATRDLVLGRRQKAIVSFYEGPWELVLLRQEERVLLSFLRAGNASEVVVQDAPCPLPALGAASIVAGERLLKAAAKLDPVLAKDPLCVEIDVLCAEVRGAMLRPPREVADARPSRTLRSALLEQDEAPSVLAFAFELEATSCDLLGPALKGRSDLHALLARGTLVAFASGRRLVVGSGRVFLQVERLLAALKHLLGAWERGRPTHVRLHGDTLQVGVRLDSHEQLSLSLGQVGAAGAALTLREVGVEDFARAVLGLARDLKRLIASAAPAQRHNPRFESFARELAGLDSWFHDLTREPLVSEDAAPFEVNEQDDTEPERAITQVQLAGARRLSYVERWWLEAEGLDLDGTFLCGDRVCVTARDTVMALDRDRGELLWRVSAPAAFSLMAGHYGLVRLSPGGAATLLDLSDGRERWRTQLRPRAGRSAGTVVGGGRGPRCVVLADGERRLVALDLNTGDQRWRFSAYRGHDFELTRAERLLLVTCGDSAVYALDVESGETVWRLTARATFLLPAVTMRDRVLACGGPPGGKDSRLFCADLASGRPYWSKVLDVGTQGVPVGAAGVAVIPGRDRQRGAVLVGLDVATGEERWRTWLEGWGTFALLGVDNEVVVCGAGGLLSSVDARTGQTRWSVAFERGAPDDVPRKLEPVLRGGALFVPADTVYVVGPRDGRVIHRLSGEALVPDLLRVDERCGIYVAEESGYLAAYGVAARLAVVE